MNILEPSHPKYHFKDVQEDDYAKYAAYSADSSSDHLWCFLVDDEPEENEETAHEDDEANSFDTESHDELGADTAQKMKAAPAFRPVIVHELAAAPSNAALAVMWPEPIEDDDDDDDSNSAFYVGSSAALIAEMAQDAKRVCVFEPAVVHPLTAACSESAIVKLWSPRSPPKRMTDSESSGRACSDEESSASITSDWADAKSFSMDDGNYAGIGLAFLNANSSISAARSLESCSDCESDSHGSASPRSAFDAASEVATPATSVLGTSTPVIKADDKDRLQKPPTTDAKDLIGLGLAMGSADADSLLSPSWASSRTDPVNERGGHFPRTLDADARMVSNAKTLDLSGFVRISGRQLSRMLDTESQFGTSVDVMPSRASSFIRLSGRRVEREMGSFSRSDLFGSPGASESKTGNGFKGRKSNSLPNFFKKIISRGPWKPYA